MRRCALGSDRVLCEASALIEKYELLGVERAAPADGAGELLRALAARGSSAAIVTSNSSRTVMRWLERHRMTALVRAIVGRDSMLPLKPAPDMVGRGLELCATPAADAVFVGDSEADLRAACAAQVGFFGVAVRAELRDRLIAAGASLVFASPSALAIYSRLR
jgi:phosphoglycolate phosphatase-like HAD superfamily hydrolase